MDVTIKLEEKNLSVDFDEQYQVKDVSNIGNVEIVMLKGEKGSKGDPGGEWSAYDLAPAIVDIASGNPVHITDGAADYPLTSAVIDIESTQSGSGDPSPSNVRPITGWTGAKVYVSRTSSSDTPAATVAFDRTVTGGTLNALTGAMTITKQMDTYDGSSDETWEKMSNVGSRRYFRGRISGQYYDSGRHGDVDVVANWLPTVSSQRDTSYTLSSVRMTTYTYASNYLFVLLGTDLPNITTVAEWRAYLAEHPLQVSYKIATAASVSVDPMEVKTLGGENYIWADCGAVAFEYKADTTARTSAARILDLIYPVGSVYTSVNDVSPATFIGGTWERFGAGRFLMGVDNGTSETTGGASSVTLQATQMPSHTHTIRVESPNADAGTTKAIASSAIVSTSTYTTEYLNSISGTMTPSAVSILPPYVTVYFWKRTA